MEENIFPIEIYDKHDLLERIKGGNVSFRPKHTSIVFIKKGELSFIVNGEERNYSENHLLFISNRNIYDAPNISDDIEMYITHNNRSFNKSPHFNFNRFEIFKLVEIEHNNAIAIPENEFEFLWSLLDNIYYQFKTIPASKYKIDILMHLQATLIYSIIGHMETSNRSLSFSHNNRKEFISTSFIELAFDNYLKEKELKFYADKLHVSIKYLSICVKDVTGYPPTYFLNQLLLYEARIRLSDKTGSIADIAEELNFADQYAFSKFFRKNMHISPSEFRKRALEIHTI